MKLGKLLAAGKSIMNGHTEVSYRSSKQIYLPKFGSAKNPFKPESSEEPAETAPPSGASGPRASATGSETIARPVASGNAAPVGAASSSAVGGARAVRVEMAESPALVPRQGEATDVPGVALAKTGQRFNACKSLADHSPAAKPQSAVTAAQTARAPQTSKFNPFSILRDVLPGGKRKDSANTAKGQRGTATQTELSLDTVRVVHNDLSDVDVEVVPIKSRAAAPELPAPKKSWEFVGERLFGVEAT
ncbi:MAG TPA: hypothetical protein VMF08_17920 [Candidatus Sulfotelmatobacter sp.]|nr:hypothetical protein [Candidatus Sulfotelmatobacter sp.]